MELCHRERGCIHIRECASSARCAYRPVEQRRRPWDREQLHEALTHLNNLLSLVDRLPYAVPDAEEFIARMTRELQCGCSDTQCPEHQGKLCEREAYKVLYEVATPDETGTRFCHNCAYYAADGVRFRDTP